ncbi:MAG TPA: SusC/RagA family TonB-linked outer membrane protein [Methanobacterium sp.]
MEKIRFLLQSNRYSCLKKLRLIMKLTTFLLLICFTTFASTGYSQPEKVSIQLNNASVKELFQSIENQTSYKFLYRNDAVENIQVTFDELDTPLDKILNKALAGSGLSYKMLPNNLIVVASKDALQQLKITGTVTDKNVSPLAGVNVIVTGTTLGAITDVAGRYSINVPQGAKSLTFSFIGMIPQEISIGTLTQIDVTMAESAIGLDEVIVVGYGTQRKLNLTGAVVSTKGDDIIKNEVPNVINSLTGMLPGIIINSRSGEPGREDPTILIRGRSTTGNSDPLIIIDGVEREDLGVINPSDIESVSVLKDASAAIYGARAANGVILVTTKRGANSKPTFNFTYTQGFTQPTREIKMADSYTFAKVYNEIETGAGRPARYSNEELQKFKDGSDPNYANTNWSDFMIKDLSPQHRTNLSVTGGNEGVKYYISIGEKSQGGQLRHSSIDIEQYNLRSNIDVKISSFLKIGLNLAARYEKNHYPYKDTYDIFSHIALYDPNWTPYWPGTSYLTPNRDGQNILNWVSDNAGTNDQDSKGLESTFTFRLDIPWIKGLYVDGSANYDASVDFAKIFRKPCFIYNYDQGTNTYTKALVGSEPDQASLNESYAQNTAMTINTKINYNKSFGFHTIGIMAGYEQRKGQGNTFEAFRSNYVSTAIPQLFAGSSDKNNQANDGSGAESARLNYFGRVTYDFAGKYLAQFIFRYDGSQNFPKNNRFGFFPGISLGWRLSEETFMKKFEFINNLKIRASYGEMGNDQVGTFQYLNTYRFGNNYVIGNSDVTGLVQAGVPNPDITWEVAKTYNLGLDATLWKGLLGIELDLFKTRRSNILTKRTAVIPDYTGLLLPDENIGIVDNKGFELILSHNNTIGELKYSLSGNISFARNKVIFADEVPAAETYQLATGRPIGSQLYYVSMGIFENQAQIDAYPHFIGTKPGDIKYKDVNKDGVINSLDQIRINQTATPEIVYGFNASLVYKKFNLSIFLQGQENAKVFIGGNFTNMTYSQGNFSDWRAENHWSPDNSTNATMPRASDGTSDNNSLNSTQWLLDAGFLRLKNVEIGYKLPHNLRIYLSGNNLVILHDHMSKQGFDPETTGFWYYPMLRTYNIGLDLTF